MEKWYIPVYIWKKDMHNDGIIYMFDFLGALPTYADEYTEKPKPKENCRYKILAQRP